MSGGCRTQGAAEKELRKAIKDGADPKKLGRLVTKVVKEAQKEGDPKLADDGK